MLLKEYAKVKARILRPLGLEPPQNTRPRENGEYRFLRHIRSLPESGQYDCIVDVGANVGDWTAEAMDVFKGSNIRDFFCVEPIPAFAQEIRTRFASRSNVRLFETVLSSNAGGKIQIFEIGGGGRMYRTSRGNSDEDANRSRISSDTATKTVIPHMVSVTTGDELFGALQRKPYVIKIDVDGHDCLVLRGFKAVIQRSRPLVQFEYCDFWIGARSRLKEACGLLYEVGYSTFKVFPDRLVRFRYNPLFETFGYQNIVAAPIEFASFSDRMIGFTSDGA